MSVVIAAIGTSIVGPFVAYGKAKQSSLQDTERIQAERLATAARRDTEHQLLKQEVEHLKGRLCEIEDLREIMHEVKNSISKIEAILPMLTKLLDREVSRAG